MQPSNEFDYVVIGGGLVGLATARAVLLRNPGVRLALVEKEGHWAAHQSGRNSGVLHSGVYYPKGSLKAQLTLGGRKMLLEYCHQHGLPVDVCGKLIVAGSVEEVPRLDILLARGRENGLAVERVGRRQMRDIEPHAAAEEGLWVPETGIVDFKAVARQLAGELVSLGADLKLGVRVTGFWGESNSVQLASNQGEISAGYVLNCAGLYSDRIARLAGLKPHLQIVPFRGEYFQLRKEARHLVRGLIYPLAEPDFPFLGVHLTRTIEGEVLAGPNAVLSLGREAYTGDRMNMGETLQTLGYAGFWRLATRHIGKGLGEMLRTWNAKAFAREVQKLVPQVQLADLVPARAGIRAQALDSKGRLVEDFRFVRAERSLHVLNAPSPAATASLAIGDYVAAEALERGEN